MSRALRFEALLAAAMFTAAPASARSEGGDAARDPAGIFANRPPYQFTHIVGLLNLQVTNLGIIGNPWSEDLVAAWRGSEYLYQASLMVGAITEDAEVHVSSSVRGQGLEFRPSASLPTDTIYLSFEGVRAGNRDGFFSGDDDNDGLLDEDFQNGRDDDGDGRIDEDFAAIGQQMFSCEYRDDLPEAISQAPGHHPLGLRVRQRSFQWAASGINEFVGLDFTVENIGDQRLRDIYIGFYVDSDVGPKSNPQMPYDDLPGFARIRRTVVNPLIGGVCGRESLAVDIAYMYDVPDNGEDAIGGDAEGFFGTLFLGHSTDPTGVKAPIRVGLTTVKWTNSSAPYPRGDPRTDTERYDLLSRRETPIRSPDQPDDYRFAMSGGPFLELDPGDQLSFQTAFVLGGGFDGMVNNAVDAQRVYNGQYLDSDKDPESGIEGRERCLRVLDPPGEVLWDDPCDSLAVFKSWRRTDCLWVDDDCNFCTGVEGKEYLVHWVGTTAPPPPELNTDPETQRERITNPELSLYAEPPGRDRRIVLQWDNLSESG